jgi:peptidoglycan/LPS O-acetylase OafA/YrhL
LPSNLGADSKPAGLLHEAESQEPLSSRSSAATAQTGSSANLDLLRACAVLAVFSGHLAWRSGYQSSQFQVLAHLGVVVFFVHTALVLMFSLERLAAGGKGIHIREFYIRRVFRIYPLSVISVLVVYPLKVFTTSLRHLSFAGQAKILIANLLLIQNVLRVRSVQDPMWSLPFEVQMYLLLPFVFILVRRSIAKAGCLWAVGLLLSPAARLTAFFPCFLAGVFAYALMGHFRARVAWGWWPATIAIIAIVFSTFARQGRDDWIPAIALGLSIPLFKEMSSPLPASAAKLVATYSYGIYLSHSPLSWLVFEHLANWSPAVKWPLYLALATAVPVAAYHLIEHPMTRLGARLAGPTCY